MITCPPSTTDCLSPVLLSGSAYGRVAVATAFAVREYASACSAETPPKAFPVRAGLFGRGFDCDSPTGLLLLSAGVDATDPARTRGDWEGEGEREPAVHGRCGLLS